MSYLQRLESGYAQRELQKLEKEQKRQTDPTKSRFIRLIQAKIARNQDARIIITGEGGVGKSTLALRLGELLNPELYVKDIQKAIDEAVSFTAKGFLTGIQTLPSESLLDFDEPGQAWYHRQFMSEASMILSKTMIGFRFKRFKSILTIPNIDLLDVDAVRLVNFMLYIPQQGKAEVFKVMIQKFGGHPWFKKIIDRFTFAKPDIKLWHAYEKRKFAVQDLLYEKFGRQLEAIEAPQFTNSEILKQILEKPDKFKKDKKYHHSLIRGAFGIGHNRAYLIKGLLESEAAKEQ